MSKTHNFGSNTKFLKIGALNTEFVKNRKIRDLSVLRLKNLSVLRLFLAKTRILYLTERYLRFKYLREARYLFLNNVSSRHTIFLSKLI